MPIRVLRPGILDSPHFDNLTTGAQAMMYRLFRAADDHGHYPADPAAIQTLYRSTVDAGDIEAWVTEAEANGVLYLYDVDGCRYLEINPFHQRVQSRPKYPGPGETVPRCPVVVVSNTQSLKQQTTEQPAAPPCKKAPGLVERVKKLIQRGVARAIAEAVTATLPETYNLEAALAYADRMVASGRIKNPPGFLVWLLRERWTNPAVEAQGITQERQEGAVPLEQQAIEDTQAGAEKQLEVLESQEPGEFRRLYEAARVRAVERFPTLNSIVKHTREVIIRLEMKELLNLRRSPGHAGVPFQRPAVGVA